MKGRGGIYPQDGWPYGAAGGMAASAANTWTAAQTMGATGTATADTGGNEYASYAWVFRSSNWISAAAANRDIKLQAEPVTSADTYQLAFLDNAGAYLGAVRSDGKWYIGSTLDAAIERAGVGILAIDDLRPRTDLDNLGSSTYRWDVYGSALRVYGTSGDAEPRFYVGPSGTMYFGAGGASVIDTDLFRDAANTLKTSDSFHVGANFAHLGSNIGFFNTAVAAKQTASGSRGSNAALASLLTALATYGLVTDSTTA